MIRTTAVWAWLFLRFLTAIALLYISWTIVFGTSLAALPLLVIAAIFLYCTLKETIHEARPHH